MKKIHHVIILLALWAIGFSCADTSLDPLKMDQVKKGTILALRGDALNNIYSKGIPIAEIFPKIANGTEKFTFEGEILASDPTTIASLDVFVVKKVSGGTERKLMKNIPFSSFTTGKYPNPSTSITLDLGPTLIALGMNGTFPLSEADKTTLLTTYKFGIPVEVDMNLVDGTKVLSADIIAAGLFQSNQFYPAMVMTWAVTDYCPYDGTSWGGAWVGTEIPGSTDNNNLVRDAVDPNTYIMDNWWGDGVNASIVFSPSTNPGNQIVTVPKQTTSEGGVASGSGTYNQCVGTFTINARYVIGGATYDFLYVFARP